MVYALIGAVLIGVSLGLLGSGGSILTVPILVYLVGHAEKAAIAESLAIVACISAVGAARAARGGRVAWRSVLWFGVPGMAGAFAGAHLAAYVAGVVQIVVLGVVMLAAAAFMAAGTPARAMRAGEGETGGEGGEGAVAESRVWPLAAQGLGVGAVTGFVGVGGGFLIVPALVLLGRMPMRLAVGTSLAIIALNATMGFLKYLSVLSGGELAVDWGTIGVFAALGVSGSIAGQALGGWLDPRTLRRVFAVFLVAIAGFILWSEVPGLL